MSKMGLLLAIDIGGTQYSLALVGVEGKIRRLCIVAARRGLNSVLMGAAALAKKLL